MQKLNLVNMQIQSFPWTPKMDKLSASLSWLRVALELKITRTRIQIIRFLIYQIIIIHGDKGITIAIQIIQFPTTKLMRVRILKISLFKTKHEKIIKMTKKVQMWLLYIRTPLLLKSLTSQRLIVLLKQKLWKTEL